MNISIVEDCRNNLKDSSQSFDKEAVFENSVVFYDGTSGFQSNLLYKPNVVDMIQVQI